MLVGALDSSGRWVIDKDLFGDAEPEKVGMSISQS